MRPRRLLLFAGLAALLLPVAETVEAQALYKYRDENGEWVYSDRRPPDDVAVETRELPQGEGERGVRVTSAFDGGRFRLTAVNETWAPVQLRLILDALDGVALPPADDDLTWVIPARDELELIALAATPGAPAPTIEYRYRWLAGDPDARHSPAQPYRAPFASAGRYRITQAWPEAITHATPDSRHAIDLAMPIGTDVHAARAGVVVDVESNQFRSGLTADVTEANLVRVLHDDGTFAIYAHLNRSTVRVRAGDRVERGEYIADSGNTGFSSGPHLHFAVMRNAGFRLESVPVDFAGPDGGALTPASGEELVAW